MKSLVLRKTRSKSSFGLLGIFVLAILSLSANVYAADVNVPDVVGMTEPNATAAITDANLVLGNVTTQYSDTVDANLVISQVPAAGTTVSTGSSVDLVVSLGQPQVPDVVGETEPNATAAITAVDNLTVGNVTY
ncbi:MAG: PASTA domain-containing protein, partial [Planctomycetota bacterium]